MYQVQDITRLKATTEQFINLQYEASVNQIENLREVLRFHEYRYYILNNPLIADYEYDQLFKALQKLEAESPQLITPDSPTQRIAKGLTKEFPTVQHLVPMLSLENSYNETDLIAFDRKVKELTGQNEIEYCVEPKFDGGSISLIFENNQLIRGATRGNGVEGDEITINIKQIRSIPLSANFLAFGIHTVEIRGEVLINKNNFAKYNNSLIEEGLPPLANPRNAASGTLRIKNPTEVSKRNLEAFVYHISYYSLLENKEQESQKLVTHSQTLEMLWELGFRSPKQEKKVFTGIQDVIAYCHKFELQRDEMPYEIDGMVVKVNHLVLQDKLGMTSHHPRWAIAYKFKARQATSKLLQVDFQVGRTGSITPVAKIQPVPIGGVTVSSISIFNEENIKEKDLKIGDSVLVERAGDVIPYIVKSFAELRTGNEENIIFPTKCPKCKSPLFKEEEEAVWRCTNIECPAQVVERIKHFASKDALDIRGFGDALISKLFELGLLSDTPSIYYLDFEKISLLEGFGKKSVENLQAAILQSKKQPLHRIIFGLGIRFVGETTAKTLANAISHLLNLQAFTTEGLTALEDVGPKVAGSIVQFFESEKNLALLKALEDAGLNLKNEKKSVQAIGALTGQTFLFTGTLPTLKRSDAEKMAEACGGKIASGVSAKLNFLVVGEDAGSKLEKAKKINTIHILTEQEFLQLIGE